MGITQRIVARLPQPWARPTAEIWETEHRLLHALGRTRAPVAVQWMVTRSCDLRCEHCYAEGGRRAKDELTTAEAKELVIDACADMGCPLLVLAGGELWLRRDMEELIEHAVARGLEWAMHTHGGHIPRHRELLRRHPPSLAAISLDGGRELHDELRGKAGSHEAALAAARVLVDAGAREVSFGTTVTRHNADHIADMFPMVAGSGAHSWGLHLVAPEGRAQLDLLPTPTQLRRLAAFARSRRAQFSVELCSEWGSAGADDAYYRDAPFLCGAGRISLVIDPCGAVTPCTTTDPREREGNVRDTPLSTIWRHGFARFRRGGDANASNGAECWLQTRNGVRVTEAAFGPVARPQPKLVDLIPPPLISLGHRALERRGHSGGFASATTRRAITAAAVGLAFIGACTLRGGTSEQPTRDTSSAEPDQDADTNPSATSKHPEIEMSHEWPPSLDQAGLLTYAKWADMNGLWKRSTLPELLAWERGGPQPTHTGMAGGRNPIEPVTALADELERYIARGFGSSSLADLLELLDRAERASLFDAALAAHLWRAAERLTSASADPVATLELRATLYARLAHHHHVTQALIVTATMVGPIPEQRAWLKKSAPPAGYGGPVVVPEGFEDSARARLSDGISGPWDSVGVSVEFEATGAPVTRYREGVATELSSKQSSRWGRLDLFAFPTATRVSLSASSKIEIEVPAGATLSHASLAELIPEPTAEELDELIARALEGDGQAVDELEVLVPIAHARVRDRLSATPNAPGAPTLRTILVAYEE